jgi:plasmid maintenance system antidote protein VapI
MRRALGTTPGIWLRLQEQRDEWELSQMPDDDLHDIEPFKMAG